MFFKQLSEIAADMALTIRIQGKNGTMAVSITPDAVDKIQPLVTNGTPEWLDENFIELIKAPIAHVKGIIVNPDAFKDAEPADDTQASQPKTASSKPPVNNKKASPKAAKTEKSKPPVKKAVPAKANKPEAPEKPAPLPPEEKKPALTPLELLMKP